eukprot:6619651-Prymnesium_polylepis.1
MSTAVALGKSLCQVGQPRLTQLAALERNRNLAVHVGRGRIHNLLELERLSAAARICYARVFMTRLQVQARHASPHESQPPGSPGRASMSAR